jgi:hypothetical protein
VIVKTERLSPRNLEVRHSTYVFFIWARGKAVMKNSVEEIVRKRRGGKLTLFQYLPIAIVKPRKHNESTRYP